MPKVNSPQNFVFLPILWFFLNLHFLSQVSVFGFQYFPLVFQTLETFKQLYKHCLPSKDSKEAESDWPGQRRHHTDGSFGSWSWSALESSLSLSVSKFKRRNHLYPPVTLVNNDPNLWALSVLHHAGIFLVPGKGHAPSNPSSHTGSFLSLEHLFPTPSSPIAIQLILTLSFSTWTQPSTNLQIRRLTYSQCHSAREAEQRPLRLVMRLGGHLLWMTTSFIHTI